MRVLLALTLTMVATQAVADADDHCASAPQPLLTVADFNGDGKVTGRDVAMVRQAINKGEYLAFFDRNADGELNADDHFATLGDMRQKSTTLDQQIAAVFHATQKYRDVNAAHTDGYRTFTQEMQGHGIHYARLPFELDEAGAMKAGYQDTMDDVVDITQPEGLNYDADGNLTAVFYYHGFDVKDLIDAAGDQQAVDEIIETGLALGYLMRDHFLPHHAFAGDEEAWHSHIGVCWDNLDYVAMQQPGALQPQFNQHMTPQQCAAASTTGAYAWNPAFNMLHLWLYKLNPCGKFAGTHPQVSPKAPAEPVYQPLEDWAQQMNLPLIESGHGGH